MASKEFNECLEILEDVIGEIEYRQKRIKDLRKQIRVHQKLIASNKEKLLIYENIIKKRQAELRKLNGGNENG